MPKLSCMTLATGAKQLVVQDAFEIIWSECESWSLLTPNDFFTCHISYEFVKQLSFRSYARSLATDKVIKDKVFLYADWVQRVSGKWSVQTITDTEYRMEEGYIRGSTYLTLLKSGLGDITFEFGHDVDQTGQAASSTTGGKELQYFYAGQISAEVESSLQSTVNC